MAKSVLLGHGYMLLDGKTVPKPFRPKTLGDAKRAIAAAFEKNRWDERSRFKYLEIHGVTPKEVNALSLGECRTILAAMEKSRIVLFQD